MAILRRKKADRKKSGRKLILFGRRYRTTRTSSKSSTSGELRQSLMKQLGGKFASGVSIHIPDSKYYRSTMAEVKVILDKSLVDRRQYTPGKGDCDDFAHLLKAAFIDAAWTDKKRVDPICMGTVWGQLPGPHAINWVILDTGVLYFIEPQSDKMFRPRKDDKGIFMMMA